MNKSTAILLSTSTFLLGILIGFLFAPAKGGINWNIGSNNGNEYKKSDDPDSKSNIIV